MIVIVEGIDRVGKTTFCEKAASLLNAPVFKQTTFHDDGSHPGPTAMVEQVHALTKLLLCINSNIVVDRFHLTEAVYGKIDRGYDCLQEMKAIDSMLSRRKDIVLAYVEPTDVEESSRQHGDDLSPHASMFAQMFTDSQIQNKVSCNYKTICQAMLWLSNLRSKVS